MDIRLRRWTQRVLLEQSENKPFIIKAKIDKSQVFAYSSSRCVGCFSDFYPKISELKEYIFYLRSIDFSVHQIRRDGMIVGFEAKYKPTSREKEKNFSLDER